MQCTGRPEKDEKQVAKRMMQSYLMMAVKWYPEGWWFLERPRDHLTILGVFGRRVPFLGRHCGPKRPREAREDTAGLKCVARARRGMSQEVEKCRGKEQEAELVLLCPLDE